MLTGDDFDLEEFKWTYSVENPRWSELGVSTNRYLYDLLYDFRTPTKIIQTSTYLLRHKLKSYDGMKINSRQEFDEVISGVETDNNFILSSLDTIGTYSNDDSIYQFIPESSYWIESIYPPIGQAAYRIRKWVSTIVKQTNTDDFVKRNDSGLTPEYLLKNITLSSNRMILIVDTVVESYEEVFALIEQKSSK